MERNMIVARIHRGLSWFYAILGIVLFVAIIALSQDREALVPAFCFLALCGGFFWLHRYIAKGASAKKPWARIVSMIIAFFLLGGVPIGSLIGIFLLMNTWNRWDSAQPPTPENLQPIDYSKLTQILGDDRKV
jgi:hypothetical protein